MSCDKYFGSFLEIANLKRSDINDMSLYDGYFAKVYDEMCKSGTNEYEMEFYYKYASLYGKKSILELACGSGRITIPLAKRRFHITGVDINADMLELLEKKMEEKYKRYKKYVKLYNQDITKLELDEQFGLVIFPATTIRLLNVDKLDFINYIYNYVQDGGCFIFDFIDNSKFSKGANYNFSFKDDNGNLNVVWVEEEINKEIKKSRVNFYTNVFADKIETYIGYTKLNINSYQEIEEVIKKSKFKSYHIEEYEKNMYFCVLKK